MPHTTLLSPTDLAAHLDDPAWVIVDCRFDLSDTAWGERQYAQAHLPGAVYAHLDRDLSGSKTGRNGRHPLPQPEALAARLGAWGIGPDTQVVAYDQHNGMWASRLWWLLRWLGHASAAVLDGGYARWMREARPVRAGAEPRLPAVFRPRQQPAMTAGADEVERRRQDLAWRVVDARAAERFRGETEPIDPVAGHIPGAINHPNALSVDPDGVFLAPAELRARFLKVLGGAPPTQVVAYCGSGVAAAHTVLAMEAAGLPGARIYPGSWSEWCADPDRPVARGES